jgi:hypothetical protein
MFVWTATETVRFQTLGAGKTKDNVQIKWKSLLSLSSLPVLPPAFPELIQERRKEKI